MTNYIRFEIEVRKYSANCVIGIYLFTSPDGKIIEKQDRIMAPFLAKHAGGDYLAKKPVISTITSLRDILNITKRK